MEQQLAEMEAEKSSEAFADMQKRMRLNHGKLFTGPKVTRQAPQSRLELSAHKKHLIADDLKSHEAEYAERGSFWRDMAKRHGMRSEHLREILRKAEEWKPLAAKPLLKKNSRNKLRKRRQGAGRKVPFEDVVRATKQWLSLERSSGHTISKQDVLSEFLARLRQSAEQLKAEAENTKLSALQTQQKLAESKLRVERVEKLTKSKQYRKSFLSKLLRRMDAKFTTTEVVSNISSLETKVRCQLTWQEFDKTLYLAALAPEAELSETKRVSDTKAFLKARPQLVTGFSDQVPFSAKATGRKAVFAEEELFDKDQTKDFSEVREAIQQVMSQDREADFQVLPLSTPSSLGKQGSKESLGTPASEVSTPGPKKKLSFDNLSPEATALVEPEPEAKAQQPQAEAKHEAVVAAEKEPEQLAALPTAGSKTTLGFSSDERFRVTYEARQLLFNICGKPEEPVRGAVGKGLLVVPGQWARLSNIDNAGKWIKTESFSVGNKVVTHLAGTSAGRALEAYRKLRTAEPDLVSQVDIMSQPAANVDSVILTWVIQGQSEEFPASVWQRDCFSSVFAEAPTQAMALANQLSCLVAAKCTAKLQITDSDFAKQFKALVRHCLTQQRTEFQELSKKTAESPLWRVGAKELVSAVVYAQAKTAEKNNSDEWVLRAAVRNGILAYRPNLQSAKLEELLSQPWAEALTEKLVMGSRRFPPEWLSDRLRWLEKSGKPREPDWRLSNSAKQLSDLLRWDYFNPEEDAEKEAEDEEPELGAELAEELELPLQNSLSLRLRPRLRRAAVRKAAEQTSEQKKLHAKHRKERQQRLALRQQLRGKLVQALRGKLLNSSRAELLGTLVPQARKLSSVTKPSVKSKPSAKTC